MPLTGSLVPDEPALRDLERRWRAARSHPAILHWENLRETVYVFRVPTGALWLETMREVVAAAREDVPRLVAAIRALRAEKVMLLDLLREGVRVQPPATTEDQMIWTATVEAALEREAAPATGRGSRVSQPTPEETDNGARTP
jgi:hypothetical protein